MVRRTRQMPRKGRQDKQRQKRNASNELPSGKLRKEPPEEPPSGGTGVDESQRDDCGDLWPRGLDIEGYRFRDTRPPPPGPSGSKGCIDTATHVRSLRGHHTPKAGFLYLRDEHAIADGAVNDDAIASIKPRGRLPRIAVAIRGRHQITTSRPRLMPRRTEQGLVFADRAGNPPRAARVMQR